MSVECEAGRLRRASVDRVGLAGADFHDQPCRRAAARRAAAATSARMTSQAVAPANSAMRRLEVADVGGQRRAIALAARTAGWRR